MSHGMDNKVPSPSMGRRRLCGGLVVLLTLICVGLPALAQTIDSRSTAVSGTDRAELFAGAPEEIVAHESLQIDVLDRIVVLLSGYEYFPTAEDLTGVTPDPVPYLLTIVYDTEGRWLPVHHHRAVGALGYFPTEQTRGHLEYLLGSELTPELMRHHIVNALANGFGDDALADLEPLLYNPDLQLRLTAVAAIGSIESERSVAALQRALLVETHDLVQERIHRALTTEPLVRFR